MTLNEYDPIPTISGGALVVDLPTDWDPRDRREICLHRAATMATDPQNDAEDINGIILTTSFADANGQLWQTSERVDAYWLWDRFIAKSVCHDGHAAETRPPHVESQSERVIVADLKGQFDARTSRLLDVTHFAPGLPNGYQRHIFPVHEKYFGYSMRLIEQTRIYQRPRPLRSTTLHLSITVQTGAESIVTLDSSGKPVNGTMVELTACNPLRCALSSALTDRPNRISFAQPANREAWENILTEAGASPEEIARLLKPNPYLKHRSKL